MLCKCELLDGHELVTLTAEPLPCSKEEGMLRWVSFVQKHTNARKFDAQALMNNLFEMGFVASLVKVSCPTPELNFLIMHR